MAVGAHAGISPNSIPLSFVADSCGLPFMHTAPHYFFLSSLRHRPLMIVFFVNDLPTNRKGFVPAIFALVRSLLFTLARPSLLSLLMFSSHSLPSLLPPPLLLPLHRNQAGFFEVRQLSPGEGRTVVGCFPLNDPCPRPIPPARRTRLLFLHTPFRCPR